MCILLMCGFYIKITTSLQTFIDIHGCSLCFMEIWFWRTLLVLNSLEQKGQTLLKPSTWISAWLLMCCFVLAVFPQVKHLQPPPWHGLTRVLNISPRTSAMLIQLALAVFGRALLFRITMGFMVLQWFVIGTELLTTGTKKSFAVHMLCLNMLI